MAAHHVVKEVAHGVRQPNVAILSEGLSVAPNKAFVVEAPNISNGKVV